MIDLNREPKRIWPLALVLAAACDGKTTDAEADGETHATISSAGEASGTSGSGTDATSTGTSEDRGDGSGLRPDLGPYVPPEGEQPPEEAADWEQVEIRGAYSYGGGEERPWPYILQLCEMPEVQEYCVYWATQPPHATGHCQSVVRLRGRVSPMLAPHSGYCSGAGEHAFVVDEVLELLTCDPACRPDFCPTVSQCAWP